MANKNINWTMAVVLSVGVHAAILGALVATSGTEERQTAEESMEAAETPLEAAKLAETVKTAEAPKPVEAVKPQAPAEQPKIAETPKTAEAPKPALADYEEYTVKSGDNLTVIARRHKSTTTELAALNGKTVAQLANLQVGQKIKVPRSE